MHLTQMPVRPHIPASTLDISVNFRDVLVFPHILYTANLRLLDADGKNLDKVRSQQ